MNLANTACGVGRKIGLTSPELLTTTHNSSRTTTVAVAIAAELPCPGAPKCSPGLAARLANSRVMKPGAGRVAGAWMATAPRCLRRVTTPLTVDSSDMANLLGCAGGALVAVDDAEHDLAHPDEFGTGLHRPRIARREELPVEVELVAVGDAARAR